jgi:D-alanyl-D-alanine carboxypeptidase
MPQLDYGLGFGVGVSKGHRWVGHNGGAPGANTELATFPENGTTVVVLSSRDPPAATALFRKLRMVLFDPDALRVCAAQAAVAH